MMVWITASARNVGAMYPVLSWRTKNTIASSSSSSPKECHRFTTSSVSSSKGSSVTWPRHTLLQTPGRASVVGSPHGLYVAVQIAVTQHYLLSVRFWGNLFLGIPSSSNNRKQHFKETICIFWEKEKYLKIREVLLKISKGLSFMNSFHEHFWCACSVQDPLINALHLHFSWLVVPPFPHSVNNC